MPLFLSDDEFDRLRTAGDASAVAEKADSYIRDLYSNLETVKAEFDATSITAEQTCSILENKYLSLSSEFSALEARYSELDSNLQHGVSELAQVQSDKHQLHLKCIEKDGEIERLSLEVKELQKSKRQVLELIGMKDTEISESKATISSYLDKITSLTEHAAKREARVRELEADLVRCRAKCDQLSQEKELIEKHNTWLNEELTVKVDSLLEQRRKSAEIEAEYSMKLADMEKQYCECSSSLNRHKEMVRELESKIESLHRELCSARDDASAAEQQYAAEISTVSKLTELYKESSEEWSKKAGELEGVIKALETHLSQVESDFKDKLEKETAARKEAEKVSMELKEKLEKCEAELEASRRTNELNILPLRSFTTEALMYTSNTNDIAGDNLAIVPHVPTGVSGTALAASLLREGWSLAKMYTKYQEAADALRHEQLGRKQTQAILEQVLLEIEEKASVIMDERAEHERMAEAYDLMNQKVQQAASEQAYLDKVICELKADLKKRERDYNYAQKEIKDLQTQVSILLKECRDVQLRCGLDSHEYMNDDVAAPLYNIDDESDAQKVISEHLLSIKDIKGLVEQNAKLRSLVRSFSDDIENKDLQLKEQYEEEFKMHKEEAAAKVAAVLERAEEQRQMIESLHSSVAMYRRLYEEEYRLRSSQSQSTEVVPTNSRKDFLQLLEGSQEATKRVQEQNSERVRCLEDELSSKKAEIISLRSEKDKFALEANFTREKLERFMKEFDNLRVEMNGVLARNIEFSQLIVDYQKKLRESADSVNTSEEHSRKLNMELSVIKHEKDLLLNSEKRAMDEVQDLSQRVYRLQATLDTIQNTEQVHEETRAEERRKQEDYIKKIEKEWVEARKELQEAKNFVQTLTLDRQHSSNDATRQIEHKDKELAAAWKAVADAEARAAVAEARCADLERTLKSSEAKVSGQDGAMEPSSSSLSEISGDVGFREQIERLKAEVEASKEHMLQYKSIAEVNDAALKQMEASYDNFRIDTERMKKNLEAEIQSLRDRVLELENESCLKSKEAASAAAQKDEALASAFAEINGLKEETLNKVSQLEALEIQVTLLKDDLEREHQRALAAQANYERQVILQSETIQELTKTSQALALLEEEASELRKTIDAYKSENAELKAKWDGEKSDMEKAQSEVAKKYDELDEQNKVLHCQLEAMHMKLAGKDGNIGAAGTSADSQSDDGLHSVVSYLRRSKEIAETEISLLKQEKLRLQSQLERALKAAEAAEAARSAERANSRNVLFTDGEFKALKLQVSEMNLLRESNMQLREENRYNFEECQKLREVAQKAKAEADAIQNLLREKELEAEALKKGIEVQRKEKELLERRISDMLEKYKSFDLEDYTKLRNEVEQLQVSLKEKDVVIEETRKLVSQKEEVIAKLEQDLSHTRLELTEKENRLSQAEATFKLEQKKVVALNKRKVDMLLREKEVLSKERESLLNAKEALLKEKESWTKAKELLIKEKDEVNKEKQAVSIQLDDLRQEKKSAGDTPVDPTMREKEKEKETRIQTLEMIVGKLREEIKKEREKRASNERTIFARSESVVLEKKKFEDEWGKYKEALRKISDELEKLKIAKDSLPEGSSVVQLLSGTTFDDVASGYILAVDNFEREARSVFNDVKNQAAITNSSAVVTIPSVAGSSQALPAEVSTTVSSTAPANYPPTKATEAREKRVLKTSVETRKTGRKLVRPRLLKSEVSQRDIEMAELDGKTVKPSLSAQPTVPVSTESLIRKRPASPSPSELQEESFLPGDSSSDLPAPALKRSKGLEPVEEDVQAPSAAQENVEIVATVEELLDAAADLPQDSIEEASDFVKDEFVSFQGTGKEPGESQLPDEENPADKQRDNTVDEEHAGKSNEADLILGEQSNLHAEQDVQQHMTNVADREEGEMLPEGSDLDGGEIGDDTATMDGQDASEVLPDHSSIPSPAPNDDDLVAVVTMEVNETPSPEISNANEETEDGEVADDAAEDSNKSVDGNDQNVGDAEPSSEDGSGVAEGSLSPLRYTNTREDSPNVMVDQEATQPSHSRTSSTTISIAARAKERAAARMGRPAPASTSLTAPASTRSPAPTSSPSPAVRRGRGALTRRGGRVVRGGRRQSSDDQG